MNKHIPKKELIKIEQDHLEMVENDFVETSDQQWHWLYALERRHVIRINQNIIIECENTRISEENKQGRLVVRI